jgi:tRNA pseudouridine38-40 synthase
MRYCIEISYNGTNFAGWQNQLNAITVQEIIEKGLSTLLRRKIDIVGSSRTDAGVHAEQQFAHFYIDESIDCQDIRYRLNQIIPFSIAIKDIVAVSEHFHARFDATSRAYQYRITRQKNPFLQQMAYVFNVELDVNKMNEACKLFYKYTDYQCFSKVHTDVATFECQIFNAEWIQQGSLLVFNIKANRFLRGMVRAIVGTLLQVGLGKLTIEQFEAIILSKNRKNAGAAVPANGLFLTEVNYR